MRKDVVLMYPVIYLSVRPEGWDRDVYIEFELPDELPVKYLNKGRSHKIQIETSEILEAIAKTGVHIGSMRDVLHIYQKKAKEVD